MEKIRVSINERNYEVDVDPQMPLLWVIRDFVGLTGTKYGCGIGQCGACTVVKQFVPVPSSFPQLLIKK